MDPLVAKLGGLSLTKYQAGHGLPQTGLPDPPTAIAAGLYPVPAYEAPSTVWRDLAGLSNQVPRWAWVGIAVVGIGIAGVSYYQANKRGR